MEVLQAFVRFGLFTGAEKVDASRGGVDVEYLDGVRAIRDWDWFVVHVEEDGFRREVSALGESL